MLAKNLKKERFNMEVEIAKLILKELIRGRIELKIDGGKISANVEGTPSSIAIMVTIIENDMLEKSKMSVDDWRRLKEASKEIIDLLKDGGGIEEINEKLKGEKDE